MEDMISRKAAIEAFLTELTKRERKNLLHTWSTVEVKYFVVKMLEQFPSAQPDSKELSSTHKALDTISRQDVIDAMEKVQWAKVRLMELPSAQPEKVDTPTVDTPNCDDTISRQAAIDFVDDVPYIKDHPNIGLLWKAWVERLPSAQPIIRCGQCKYAEVADKEDAQDGYTCQFHRGSVWFSGSYCSWAERRTDVKADKGASC